MHEFDWIKGALVPYINFFLFITMAYYFFRKPAHRSAVTRHEQFQALMREAQELMDQARQQQQQLDQRLMQLDQEVEQLIAKARKAAEHDAQLTITEAQKLASHIEQEAKRVAEAELLAVRTHLEHEIVDLVRQKLTSELSQQLSDQQKQHQVVQKSIRQLESFQA